MTIHSATKDNSKMVCLTVRAQLILMTEQSRQNGWKASTKECSIQNSSKADVLTLIGLYINCDPVVRHS